MAVIQLNTGEESESNRLTVLRLIDRALTGDAATRPELLVLPELLNHLSWYRDQIHASEVSLDTMDHLWLSSIAQKAKYYKTYIVANFSMRKENPGGKVVSRSVIFGPDGTVQGTSEKRSLLGHEILHFDPGQDLPHTVETPFGRIAAIAGGDALTPEAIRGLALRGCDIICVSSATAAPDEAWLHLPARAAENKVWILSSNKSGPLVPKSKLHEISVATKIPTRYLTATGQSQIISPGGVAVASAGRSGEAVVISEVNLESSRSKSRPDGTEILQSRRVALYRPLYRSLSSLPPDESQKFDLRCFKGPMDQDRP